MAIILAGGKGKRMCQHKEKPLLEIGEVKMIDLVIDAVKKSSVEEFYVAVSPNTFKTKKYCQEKGFRIIETGGKNYHADIAFLLKLYPVFVSLPSDTPFLTCDDIDDLVMAYTKKSITGCVCQESLPEGITPSHTFECGGKIYTSIGVNVVTDSENSEIFVFDNPLLGINVNTTEELEIARKYFLNYGKADTITPSE
ncbi:MAG: NTP transferase domain-containing protein [Theionarchaea archaeon]|nr:NTP transferase domain-containing protein [Theionarchaea archaeon]